MDEHIEKHLRRVLDSGEAILFVGAGFSGEARDASGRALPSGRELGREIWKIPFPRESYDESASLADIFAAAKLADPTALKRHLEQRLRADPRTLPDFYRRYLAVDWSAVYTLNIDNVLEVAATALGRPMQHLSALSNSNPVGQRETITHLNGLLKDYPDVTFTSDDFAVRTTRQDAHYAALASRLAQSSVIYIGTQLEESPLWHHIAARGERQGGRELRPRSYLIAPTLGVAKAAALKRHNVHHVPLTARQFAEAYLPAALPENLRPSGKRGPTSWSLITTVRTTPVEQPADFLLGREPDWGDVTAGFAIERSFESELYYAVTNPATRVVVVSGTVGSGKSTTLRRLAVSLDTDGYKTLWLERAGSDRIADIAGQALEAAAEYVLIDDAERFSGRVNTLVGALCGGEAASPTVVLAYPTTHRADFDPGELGLDEQDCQDFPLPHMDDADIEAMLDALTQARRLGVLAGKPRESQRKAFRDASARQLLVALLEATSGRRFEEMIDEECAGLDPHLSLAYAICAIATMNGYHLPRPEFLTAIGSLRGAGLQEIDALVKQKLIFADARQRYATRHTLIAERVMHYYRGTGQLPNAYLGLVYAMAMKFQPMQKQTAERRLLTALLNHDRLGKLFSDRQDVRAILTEVEGLLADDAHYWLQRGSYEVENGDMTLAENFLSQARSLGEGDYMIDTEWSYLRLRQARSEKNSAKSIEYGNEALEILFAVIADKGERTPNTYSVLLQEGSAWVLESSLPDSEKRGSMEKMRLAMDEGRYRHPGNSRLRVAAAGFERVYLMQAVPK